MRVFNPKTGKSHCRRVVATVNEFCRPARVAVQKVKIPVG